MIEFLFIIIVTGLGCYFMFYHLIYDLTFKEIYDLKIKNKIPFLMNKRDKMLLQGLEIITELRNRFNMNKTDKLYQLVLETLAYYEATNKSVSELDHFIKLKVLPLKSVANQIIKSKTDQKCMEHYNDILDTALVDIAKSKQKLIVHDEKVAIIELKVLKSYYS